MSEIKSTSKYHIRRMYKTIGSNTYPMDVYEVTLVEADSEDCGYIAPQYQWSATTGYLCDYETYTKYAREVYMVSYDSGVTWSVAQPIQERRGEVIAYDSYDCGRPMYRCVDTGARVCQYDENLKWVAKYSDDTEVVSACSGTNTTVVQNEISSEGLEIVWLETCANEIGEYAFYECSTLKEVYMTNVQTIHDGAFQYCTNLKKLVINEGVTQLGDDVLFHPDGAFEDCYSLTSVTLPNSLTIIGQETFHYCSGLTSINIPSGVTKIGQGAFANCTSLNKITLPSGLTNIYGSAFANTGLYECTILATTPPSISNDAPPFANTNCLIYVPAESLNDYKTAYGWTRYANRLRPFPFVGKWRAFNTDNSVTTAACGSSSATSNNEIEKSGITSVNIGDCVNTIGWATFSGFTSLTSVSLSNSVTDIAEDAFYGCSSLSSITIPSGVTSIGHYAFAECSSLSSFTCLAHTPPTLGVNVFNNTNCTIYVIPELVDTYKNAAGWSDLSSRIRAIS